MPLEYAYDALSPGNLVVGELMSISEESDCPASQATLRDLMRWFGANDATLESAERVFEELVECVETSAAATPTLLAWGGAPAFPVARARNAWSRKAVYGAAWI